MKLKIYSSQKEIITTLLYELLIHIPDLGSTVHQEIFHYKFSQKKKSNNNNYLKIEKKKKIIGLERVQTENVDFNFTVQAHTPE